MEHKIVFTILLIGHFLGDFYFQPQEMADKKNQPQETKALLAHGFVYLLSLALPFCLLFSLQLKGVGLLLIIPLLHFVVDFIKGKCLSKRSYWKKHHLFLFLSDQAVHLLVIAAVVYIYATLVPVAYSGVGIFLKEACANLHLQLTGEKLLYLSALFLFLGKPVNIFIRRIINKDDEKAELKESGADQKAGRIIGVLERYLTAILILLGQYAAIGLTFTAKSVTRFDKISKEPAFAEQYLIGTMSSLLFTIIGAVLYMFII